MKDPEIKRRQMKTYRREYLKRAPYIIANRLDLIKAKEAGCSCGYKGAAIMFMATPEAPRSPATLTTVSRKAFLKALAGSKMMCYNCAVEQRGTGGRPRKQRVLARGTITSSLQAALAVEDCFRGTEIEVDSSPCLPVPAANQSPAVPTDAIAKSVTPPPLENTGSEV